MADHDDELAEAVRELTRTIDDLRQELESTQGRSRLRPPAPRPPTPQDLLRFTDEVAIPATIAVLETSVRALEGFQHALKLARTEREVRDRTADVTSTTSERADKLRQTTLSRLDTILAHLQQAASDGTLPADDNASDLLSEARTLRDEVDSRLRDADDDLAGETNKPQERGSTDAVTIDIQDGDIDDLRDDDADSPSDRNEPDPRVDVDAELETLKDQYGADEEDSSETDDHDIDGSGASASPADTADSDIGDEADENASETNGADESDSSDDADDTDDAGDGPGTGTADSP